MSVRGPAIGQAIMMPMKLLNAKRPRAGAVKRYGGGPKRDGARVEIATTLGNVSLIHVCMCDDDLPS